jgi:hypothetical protein
MTKKVKKLLEENTIRKFMKYADITPLAENFLDTVEEEAGLEDEADEESPAEPEMGMEPEMDMEPTEEVDEEMVQRIVTAVADAIQQETGVEVQVDGAPEMGPEDELGDLEEPAMDMEPEEGPEVVELSEEDVDEGAKYNREEDESVDEAEEFDYESVVAEVARRVALRLVKESKKK